MAVIGLQMAVRTINAVRKRANDVFSKKPIRDKREIDLNTIEMAVKNTSRWLRSILTEYQLDRGPNNDHRDNRMSGLSELAVICVTLLSKMAETHRLHIVTVKKMVESCQSDPQFRPPSKRAQDLANNYRNKSMDSYINCLRTVKETGGALVCLVIHLKMGFKHFGHDCRNRSSNNSQSNNHNLGRASSTMERLQQFSAAFDDQVEEVVSTLQNINERFNLLAVDLDKLVNKITGNDHQQQNQISMESEWWKAVGMYVHKTMRKVVWAKKMINGCRDAEDVMELKFQRFLDKAQDRTIRLRRWFALMVLFALSYLLLIQQLLAITWAILICVGYAAGANYLVEWSTSRSRLGIINSEFQSDKWTTDHVKLPSYTVLGQYTGDPSEF